jgi:hypothetical protein
VAFQVIAIYRACLFARQVPFCDELRTSINKEFAFMTRFDGLVSRLGIQVLLGVMLAVTSLGFSEDKKPADTKATSKKKNAGAKGVPIDPWNRPEGSIVEKTARYYLWYDSGGWHLRACSIRQRNFHGTVRVTNGKVKSCVSVGLKERSKTGDAWTVNEDRSELRFSFSTSTRSDGLDIRIEGDEAQLEFDLNIDKDRAPKLMHIGKNEQHPATNPFTLPAVPLRSTKDASKK